MLHHRLRASARRPAVGIPTAGLIAHYTMDNIVGSTLVDEKGNFDGTIVGAVSEAGVAGQALRFDSTGRVEITGLLGGLDEWTFCALVNPTDGVNGAVMEYDWGPSRAGAVVFLNEPASSRCRFLYRVDGVTSVTLTTPVPLPGGYSTLVFGYNGTEIYAHVGGTRYATNFGATVTPVAGADSTVGNRETNTNGLRGALDTTAVYNRTLTTEEVSIWEGLV